MSRFVFDAASGNYVQQDVVSSATANDVVNHDDYILSALAEIRKKIDAMQLILDSHHDEICKIITYLGEETEDEDFENNN